MVVKSLKLVTYHKGQEIILHPTLIEINQKVFLVDCGYEESYTELVRLLSEDNLGPEHLYGILISHNDIDHIGSLSKWKEANPGLLIFSSAIEEPSLSGKIKSERLEQAERLFRTIPEEQKAWALDFERTLRSIKHVPVNETLEDGDLIEKEVQVIHTPGHTKGHISFYVKSEKLLIANDAFVIQNNSFEIANPEFTLDLQEAINSIRKLSSYEIEKVICYHGGDLTGNIKTRLATLIDKFAVPEKSGDKDTA